MKAFLSTGKTFGDGLDSGWKSSILLIGYPFFIFLFIVLPSSSAARNLLVIIAFSHIWFHRQQCLAQIVRLTSHLTILAGSVLIAYAAFSLYWSTPPFNHNAESQLRYGFVTCLFWFVSILYFQRGEASLKYIYWAFSAGIIGNLLGTWLTGYGLTLDGRLTGYGVLNNPIIFGSVSVIQVAIGLHLRYRTLVEQIAGIAMLVLAIILILLTGSRGPLLGMLAVVVVWLLCRSNIKTLHKLLLIAGSLGAFILVAQVVGLIDAMVERGISIRSIIWQETLRACQQHLLFGWGWANEFNQSPVSTWIMEKTGNSILHPHGLLISSLYYGGIIGLGLHLLFLGAVSREAFRTREHGLTIGLLAAVFLLTAADTSSAVGKRDYMWLIFWIPVTIIITSALHKFSYKKGIAPRSADEVT